MATYKADEKYDDKEARRRFEAALRGGLSTSPKPLKSMAKKTKKQKSQKLQKSG